MFDPITGIYTSRIPATEIPEGLSIYDLMFEETPQLSQRAERKGATWLIDSNTSVILTYEQVKERTLMISAGLAKVYNLQDSDVLAIYSGNCIDWPTSVLATLRLGSIVSAANPSYSSGELAFQLGLIKKHYPVKVLLTEPASLGSAIEACEKAGLPTSILLLISSPDASILTSAAFSLASQYKTIDDIIRLGKGYKLPRKQVYTPSDKIAFLSFSSGTTGLPKGVMITHYGVVANIIQSAHHNNNTVPSVRYDSTTKEGDIAISVLPFFHIYGLIVVLHGNLYANVPICIMSKFTLPTFLSTIQRYRVTNLFVVPPMVIGLVKNDTSAYDLTSVKYGMVGASPLSAETFAALKAKFPSWIFGQGYGMTETSTTVASYDGSRPIIGASAGVLIPNVECKVLSPDGTPLCPGQVGELFSKSPSNALGYLGNEKATKETFDEEGYIRTGDEVKIDIDGNLYIVDRIKELIKVLSNQVPPAELEGLLLEHPDVLDCCVIGIPNELTGEVPKAYVALTAAALEKVRLGGIVASASIANSIMKFVAERKIRYKHISEVEFLSNIPKTASGKLLRKDLRVLHATSQKMKSKL